MKHFASICIAAGLLLVAGRAISQPALKETFKDRFLVGASLNESQFSGENPTAADLIRAQFDSISPENVMKWDSLQPLPGKFNFQTSDRYVSFGLENGMFIVGHTLVWHAQTPDWVFEGANGKPLDRDTLLKRMRDHIHAVVGRYRGKVKSWDVVNEALDGDGTLRTSPWRQVIGDDYIAKAFQFAHEADPAAELFYNDFGIEAGPKRDGALALIRKLKAAGVPITGVGIQEHVGLPWPSSRDVDEAITAFGRLGIKVAITELDIDVLPSRRQNVNADVNRSEAVDPALNPYAAGLPDDVQQALARRYAELFAVYLKHHGTVVRVTFWGVTDGDSWLNNWPIRGRTSYPMLFDRAGRPKPAFYAVLGLVRDDSQSGRERL
ncbi:MAG: endo-1,4-beta-xylanase [Chthoniobacterales bacterium]